MSANWKKLNYSLSGRDPETARFVFGLFRTAHALKQATSALNRHQFVDEDLVQVIDQNKVSPEDTTNGQVKPLADILLELGFSPQKAEAYAEKLKQGYLLLRVRTGVERVREAMNIMLQANAEEIKKKGETMPEALKVYSEAEIKTKLANQLPGWSVEDNHLRRTYQTDGWQTTLMVVNAIAFFAEAADHHPDLTVSWPKVRVSLQSHSAGGITDMDIELAKKIEAAVLWRPPADSVFEGGTSKKWVEGGNSEGG